MALSTVPVTSSLAVLVGERDVEHRLGFGRHVAREIEAREIEPRRLALGSPAPAAASRINSACRSLNLASRSKPQTWVSNVKARKLLRELLLLPSAVDDSDSPPGRLIMILSTESSAVMSSASGCTTTPWVDGSARNSTKFWPLRKPRAGPSAVITISRSPMSGSASMMKLARLVERNGDAGAVFADDSARDGERPRRHRDGVADIDDPARPVGLEAHQPRPLQLDAHDGFAVLRRRRTRRCGSLGWHRLSSAPTSILAALSNTSHSMSARRKTAAGVGTANGNSARNIVARPVAARRRPAHPDWAPGCLTSAVAGLASSFGAAGSAALSAPAQRALMARPLCSGTVGAFSQRGGSAFGGGSADGILGWHGLGRRRWPERRWPRQRLAWALAWRVGALGLAACLGSCFGLAPSCPTSTTMLRSSRKRPHLRRAVERKRDRGGVDLGFGLDRLPASTAALALASARSHLIC